MHTQEILEPTGLGPNSEIRVTGGATSSSLVLDCLVHSWPTWVHPAETDRQLDKLSALSQGEPYLPTSLTLSAAIVA